MSLCNNGNLDIISWLYNLDKDKYFQVIKKRHIEILRSICSYGYLSICKWIYQLLDGDIDIHYNNELLFQFAYSNNNLNIVKWLLSLEDKHGKINISSNRNNAFRIACFNNCVTVIKYLETLYSIEEIFLIQSDNEWLDLFKKLCNENKFTVIKWIYNLHKSKNKLDKKILKTSQILNILISNQNNVFNNRFLNLDEKKDTIIWLIDQGFYCDRTIIEKLSSKNVKNKYLKHYYKRKNKEIKSCIILAIFYSKIQKAVKEYLYNPNDGIWIKKIENNFYSLYPFY